MTPHRSEPSVIKDSRDSLPFQRREWLVQRVGWVLWALTLLAALLGLFGDGPLAKRALAGDGASLEYEAYARRHASTEWVVRPVASPAGGVLRVSISAEFARRFRITEVQPQPVSARIEREALVYEFDARAPAPLVFHLEPQFIGEHHGSIRVGDGPAFQVSQFIYP